MMLRKDKWLISQNVSNIIAVLPSSLPQSIMLTHWTWRIGLRWSFSVAAPPSFWTNLGGNTKGQQGGRFCKGGRSHPGVNSRWVPQARGGQFQPPLFLPQTKFCEFTYYLSVFQHPGKIFWWKSINAREKRYNHTYSIVKTKEVGEEPQREVYQDPFQVRFFLGGGAFFQFCHVLSFFL